MFEIALAHALPLARSPRYKQRLREGRLVAFVVPAPAIAVHVDHDVALELRAEIHRQPHDLRDGLGIFAVDVEDRDLQHLRHVGGVGTSSVPRPATW